MSYLWQFKITLLSDETAYFCIFIAYNFNNTQIENAVDVKDSLCCRELKFIKIPQVTFAGK